MYLRLRFSAAIGLESVTGLNTSNAYHQIPRRPSTVVAIDSAAVFIDALTARAKQLDLDRLIVPIQGDMANLDRSVGVFDLLWSEGAIYHLGFERGLKLWRPLLVDGGIAVISELSWFIDRAPDPAIAYWQNAYPMMGTEAENIVRAASPLGNRANRSGFSVLSTHRLPSQAWWVNYYEPLRERMQQIEITPITRWRSLSARQSIIDETEAEMRMFERFSDSYGYTFYVLQAV